ncbi:hypothetical protein RHMOL_Rhmol01G0369800 [Rhododendron molle]|uniref:Uncharacterized protein n=1 Tax=Rhododendron molle TaxID=49168 RepID=A0ACC0QB13_RHOML|nr:hypothetical protein RHMOL_Rhmol01G0369800 [Rhododendron molle]
MDAFLVLHPQIVHWKSHLKVSPGSKLTPEAKDLICRLLCNVEHRQGSHPWFKDVWDKLHEIEAAFKPEVNGELDTQNSMKFDEIPRASLSNLVDNQESWVEDSVKENPVIAEHLRGENDEDGNIPEHHIEAFRTEKEPLPAPIKAVINGATHRNLLTAEQRRSRQRSTLGPPEEAPLSTTTAASAAFFTKSRLPASAKPLTTPFKKILIDLISRLTRLEFVSIGIKNPRGDLLDDDVEDESDDLYLNVVGFVREWLPMWTEEVT